MCVIVALLPLCGYLDDESLVSPWRGHMSIRRKTETALKNFNHFFLPGVCSSWPRTWIVSALAPYPHRTLREKCVNTLHRISSICRNICPNATNIGNYQHRQTTNIHGRTELDKTPIKSNFEERSGVSSRIFGCINRHSAHWKGQNPSQVRRPDWVYCPGLARSV